MQHRTPDPGAGVRTAGALGSKDKPANRTEKEQIRENPGECKVMATSGVGKFKRKSPTVLSITEKEGRLRPKRLYLDLVNAWWVKKCS